MPTPTPDTALKPLNALLGHWTSEGWHPSDPSMRVRGAADFEWLDGEAFIVHRWTVEPVEFPNGIAIIGADAATGEYAMHYFDSRGVARVYEMSLSDDAWTLRREASPDSPFAQRYIGTFEDDGNTINGRWEKSDDGSGWALDFHMKYTKVS